MDTIEGDMYRNEIQQERKGSVKTPTKHSPLITIVALFYILLWSSAFIATKVGVTHSPPLTLLAARFLAAALLMALLARVWRLPRPQGWSAWGRLALFGLLNSSLCLGCNYVALRYLSADQ